jgi:hypothetical protein
MKVFASLGVLGAAVTLAGCQEYAAPPPAPAAAVGVAAPASAVAPACFRTQQIRGHTLGDDHTIYLNVNDRAVYRVEVDPPCLAGATSSDAILTRSPPGSNLVCRAIDLDLSVTTGGVVNRCIVNSITPLTPAEVAALPAKLRP